MSASWRALEVERVGLSRFATGLLLMLEVYTARDEAEAERVWALLRREGIDAVVRGEPLNILGLRIPVGQIYPSVCVRRVEDVERARAIVETMRRQEREKAAREWRCPACGEEVGGQFAECWQCGASAPESSAE